MIFAKCYLILCDILYLSLNIKMALRNDSKLTTVYIVEDHDQILPAIHRCIGSKILPMGNIKMVHFDSHPDMLIPQTLKADSIYDKHTVYGSTSIENWLIPLIYAGHIDHVSWLKPNWAEQMNDQHTKFNVGKDPESGFIRVSCKELYFLSELLYKADAELVNKQPLSFAVQTVSSQPTKASDIVTCDNSMTDETNKMKRQCVESKTVLDIQFDPEDSVVLDIDLDFFSVQNPFKIMYSHIQFDLLHTLYSCESLDSPSELKVGQFLREREEQLSDLKQMFHQLKLGVKPDDLTAKSPTRLKLVKQLVKDLKKHPPNIEPPVSNLDSDTTVDNPEQIPASCSASSTTSELSPDIDYEWLHEVGCTCDIIDLPHHVSTKDEIVGLVQQVRMFLESMKKPAIITVARSSDDDYCPKDQVEFIQEKVLAMLTEVYGNLTVNKLYENME